MKRRFTPLLRRYLTLLSIIIIAVFSGYRGPDSLTLLKLLENWEHDIRIARSLATEATQHPEIVLVTITEQTLQQFPYRSPVDRGFLSELLNALDQHGVKGILVDLLFDQPTEVAKDNALATTIRKLTAPLVVSYTDNLTRQEQQDYLNSFVPAKYRGLAQLAKDESKMTRWIYPGHKVGDDYVYGAASALAIKLGKSVRDIPATKTPIAWRGAPADDVLAYPFTAYASHSVLFLLQHTDWLKDKIVLVGSEFDITDRHLTPFTLAPEVNAMSTSTGTPGVFIHANNLAQIMDSRSAPKMSAKLTMVVLTAAALLGLVVAFQRSRFYLDIIIGASVIISYWICGVALFHSYGWMLPLLMPTLSFLISFMLATMYLGKSAEEVKDVALEETRVKSEFLANMSHEIRSPMNTIIGMTELVLESALTNTQQKYLKIVVNSAHSLLNLINDILDLSKLESGKMTIEKTPFDLADLLQEITATLAVQSQHKGLKLASELAEELPVIRYGDPLRLRQVVTNLVGNAIKFTEVGGVSIHVSADQDDDQSLLFAVKDTGIGIPEDRQQAIFESFTQADGATARKHGGTGLGTTIAKQIVGLMDGKIWLQSTVGQGSVFFFKVKLPVADTNTALTPSAGTASKSVPSVQRMLHILLVDDMEENLLLSKTRLEQRHHRVSVAKDGQAAIECWQHACWQEQPFDLLLMDVQMPVMDGFAATRTIRRLESQQGSRSPVPIIAMTANAMKGDREKCLQAGMTDYVSKPINFAELFNKIATVLPANAGEPQPAEPGTITGPGQRTAIADQPAQTNRNWAQHLRGIDVASGLVIWNQAAIYQKALVSFASSHHQDAHHIARALQREDWAAARFITHGLKGVAANLAANNLAEIAEEMDALLLMPQPAVSTLGDLNQQLREELILVTESVSILETNPDEEASTAQWSTQDVGLMATTLSHQQQATAALDIEQLLNALWQQIDAGEINQADVTLGKLQQLRTPQILQPYIKEIFSHLDNFDFDDAKQALFTLMVSAHIKPPDEITEQD